MPILGLGAWNYYFLAKLVLYWRELIGFHPLENLAFAAFLLLPVASTAGRRARSLVAVPIGVALLYYDSWLPPITRTLSQASLLSSFSLVYFAELAGRFINWSVVAMLVITWAAYRIVAMRVRVGVVVVGALIVLACIPHPAGMRGAVDAGQTAHQGSEGGSGESDLDKALGEYYAGEARRSVAFTKPAAAEVPFDVIFLHVCSLSWDDLRAMGLQDHPLWKRFDIVLTRFNSAASYSGPAAIRLLRAPCGQTSHMGLYSPVAQQCYLMASLEAAGFKANLVLNHDGHFDDFLGLVRGHGGLNIPALPLTGIPVAQRSFDDSPIYDDMAVLSRWLDTRQKNNEPRVATYFNTISLHDGNRLAGAESRRSSLETYKTRLIKLLNDLDQFIRKLEGSSRRAVVVLAPEHGAAVRGDKMQIAGLREIPSPAITLVPVGVKVVGAEVRRAGEPMHIDTPTSYLAISHIVARMLEKSPFTAAVFNPADYLNDLPATTFVAENAGMLTMRRGDKYFLRLEKEGWSEYPVSSPRKESP